MHCVFNITHWWHPQSHGISTQSYELEPQWLAVARHLSLSPTSDRENFVNKKGRDSKQKMLI